MELIGIQSGLALTLLTLLGVATLYIYHKSNIDPLKTKIELLQKELNENRVQAHFDYTTKIVSGFFSKKIEVTYFYLMMKGGIPIGPPVTLKVDQMKVYDKDQIQKVLTEVAGPLMKTGIKVALFS